MKSTAWLVPHAAPSARLRLYCFSYAGGSAAYYAPWQALLGPAIQICAIELPGRGTRFLEAPPSSMEAVVSAVAQAIARQDELPFAFFGHSLGALLAFEVARHCRAHGLAQAEHLFVSGCAAPRLRDCSHDLHMLDDGALIEALRDYNGTPAEVLDSRELMDLLLPMIRADFALAERYQYRAGPALDIPVSVLAGKRDEGTSIEQAQGWAQETSADCSLTWYQGDHFFLNPERAAVLDLLRAALLGLPCH
ncbi:surfactin synthase thioesterase subunit [Oxalobacteraceae bacterium GrIS 1.11]